MAVRVNSYDRARFTNATAWVDMRERAMDTAAQRNNPGMETQTLWGFVPPATPAPPRKDGPMFTVSEPTFTGGHMVHRVYNMQPGVPTLLPEPLMVNRTSPHHFPNFMRSKDVDYYKRERPIQTAPLPGPPS